MLRPIEGSPPDLRREPTGCPFAPRCAWRLDTCWSQMPELLALEPASDDVAEHVVACHNPVTPEEVELARPDRPGFEPAPPPQAVA
jgi:ABC-type dipeptide/oligopeptide/nickel transport system ATPase component